MSSVLRRVVLLLCLLGGWCTVQAGNQQDVDEDLRQALKEAVEESSSFEDRFEAQVWLMDMSDRLAPIISNEEKRLRILRKVHAEAARVDLDPELVLAVIQVESNFDRFAISVVGARGLMQIMPFWLEEIGRPDDNLFDIATNLRFGCTILRHYLDKEDGNLTRALARYNGSLGSMRYPSLVYTALAERWHK
ncbi:soluble lytic murein transglycosylase-like protein [Natronospira proteinivora]|uniref:Soluble lytic murein transglycosylase-like protein n=1 Tax=Natronospira proteinivora TaxID=1807133 RepID=A0ABT1G880_9GAMM|nr:lytic transglycosylase domain-containing protein [Natronospira proteinivora]MCP1726172.1 soluble lytic murein transglycosylase-like protein [Natronospira proteinivora]